MSAVKAHLAAAIAGALFGLGLTISGMTNPQKVLNFLDVFGTWDPSLLLVMAGAVLITLGAFRLVLRADRPLFHPQFHLPTRTDVDARLLLGAAVFGVGWGLAGYCPGPGLAALATGYVDPAIFVIGLVAGSELERLIPASRLQGTPPS